MCLELGKSLSGNPVQLWHQLSPLDSSTELGFGPTITEKEIVYDSTTDSTTLGPLSIIATTISTMRVHAYADEQSKQRSHYDTCAHKFCSPVLPRNGSALYKVHEMKFTFYVLSTDLQLAKQFH